MVRRSDVAFGVSALSSPYLVATSFGLLAIAAYAPSTELGVVWSALYFLLIVGVPFAYILAGVLGNRLSDMHVAVLAQRNKPILAAITGAFACTAAFAELGVPTELRALSLTVSLNGVLFLIASEYAKVSFHVGTFVGSVITAGILVSPWLFSLVAIAPLIAWARAERGKHTPWQSLAGAGLSSAGTLTVFALTGII